MSDSAPAPPEETTMIIDPSRASALISAYRQVSSRVATTSQGRNVRLVAVSKLKPATDILALHQSDFKVTHFGENYAQELTEKAEVLPKSINWHFIGGLQSNKCKSLASSIFNLFCVSSVDSVKKATLLSQGRSALLASSTNTTSQSSKPSDSTPSPIPQDQKLNIHIQINTSSESSKSGVLPGPEVSDLCKHVIHDCPYLHLLGFMTIGAIARSQATEREEGKENEDFRMLREERDRVATELGLGKESLELTMGMSADFEEAIGGGSCEVRVGSTIFGERMKKGS